MIGMSEAVMPIPSGMEFPLPLAPLAGEGIASEQGFSFSPPPKEVSQWEQFEKCSQSLALAVKSLGDGIAKEQVLDKVEVSQASDFEKPLADTAMPKSVYVVDSKEVVAIENPRRDIPEYIQVKDFEKPLVNTAMSQQVQIPDSFTVSRLVDTIVEKIVVSSTLMSNGEGEISIQLKSNVLDGSSVKIEVKNGELKVVVEPASYIAEQILVKSQEMFQNQLAERVTAWRVNVGVAAFDSRNHGKHRLEEDL